MKILSLVLPVLLLPFVAMGQIFQFKSFLAVQAVHTGTNSLGTAQGLTNLITAVTNAGLIHSTNVLWTNANTQARSAASGTNVNTTKTLFNDVPLWSDREGRPPIVSGNYATDQNANTNYARSALTLFVKIAGNWQTNGPIGINIAPVWDGSNTQTDPGTTPTSHSDDWSIIVPGGWFTTYSTNVPLWKWPGARALRVRYVTNQFIQGGETAITNSPAIVKLGIGGFIP